VPVEVGVEAPASRLVSYPAPHYGSQPVAEQGDQLRQRQRGHRGAQVYHRSTWFRQLHLVRWPTPAALLTDRPGQVQQRVQEPPPALQALGHGQQGQPAAPLVGRRLVALAGPHPLELQVQGSWQGRYRRRGRLLRRLQDVVRDRCLHGLPRRPVGGLWERPVLSRSQQRQLDLSRVVIEHIDLLYEILYI